MNDYAKSIFEANPNINAVVVFSCGNAFEAKQADKIAAFEKFKGEKGVLVNRDELTESKPKSKK